MVISESIRSWVQTHGLEETLLFIGSGTEIRFRKEEISTKDTMAVTILTAAFAFYDVERERRSILQHELYMQRAAAGEYIPRCYFGYEPFSFIPSSNRKYVIEMFQEAADGVEMAEIAEWMNDCGLLTVLGNPFTPRAVRSILTNPVYCGDVVFHSAGRTVHDHHTPLVPRPLWERCQERLLVYKPRCYFGYEPYSFTPSDERKYVIEMFMEAADGVDVEEITEWMNDCGLRTVLGNSFTPRAVKAILRNPIYCGDVVFHKTGKRILDHHRPLVPRSLWERVNGIIMPAAGADLVVKLPEEERKEKAA